MYLHTTLWSPTPPWPAKHFTPASGARPLAVYSDFNFLLLSVFQRLVVIVVVVVLEMSGLEQRKRTTTTSVGGS